MKQSKQPEICLRIPGEREYTLVLRTALGGVAMLKDLDVDTLDDLRMATDEACDCLLNQGRPVECIELCVTDAGHQLYVTLKASFAGEEGGEGAAMTEVSRMVLETLIPCVDLTLAPCGCVEKIDLVLTKAAV